MNARAAITETMETLRSGKWESMVTRTTYIHHLYEMEEKVGVNQDMSIGKLNRWLGWTQATLCICTNATLTEMKAINKKHAD